MRKMMKYGKAFGGGDPEMIAGDIFRMIVECPDFETHKPDPTELRLESRAQSRAQSGAQSRLQSRLQSQLAAKVLLIKDVESGKSQLATGLDHKTVSGELHKQIKRLLDLDLIEMTIPDKPNSHLQKYHLTEAGIRFLESSQE